MSIIHGSQGLIYFVHQFKPAFRESALLDDEEMLEAVTRLNLQIMHLAAVLRQPNVSEWVTTRLGQESDSVATMVKRYDGELYVFAVEMRGQETAADFALKEPVGKTQIEVMEEGRSIALAGAHFSDRFKPWEVHLYRIRAEGQ
jgi:hypothetical protein